MFSTQNPLSLDGNRSILCPSHRCKPGSHLLGVRQDNGTIAILPQPLKIDEDFINNARQSLIPPEQRFRFTNKCIDKGCKQWNGKGCEVAERVIGFLNTIPENSGLPECSIRNSCRWFLQKGTEACKICPYVLTEITDEEMQSQNY